MTRDPRTNETEPEHYGLFSDGDLVSVLLNQRDRPTIFDFRVGFSTGDNHEIRPVRIRDEETGRTC